MPVIRNTPENRRRVRTGCLTCRGRRRKCDERKPRCQNCEAKGFSCRYPGVTFVAGSNLTSGGTSRTSDRRGRGRGGAYAAITFVNDAPPTPLSTGSPKPSRNQNLQTNDDHGDTLHDVASSVHEGLELDDSELALGNRTAIGDSTSSQSRWSDYYFSIQHASPNKAQTALLLHFQYHLAPWIEAGDPTSKFGTEMMLLAQKKKGILDAISAVSSCHIAMINRHTEGFRNGKPSWKIHEEISKVLVREERWVQQVVQALLTLLDLVHMQPRSWNVLPFYSSDEWVGGSDCLCSREPLKTLLRFHLRIDLASALCEKSSPATSLSLNMYHDILKDPAGRPATWTIYDTCLALLAGCLHLVYGKSPESEARHISSFSSKWSSLWASCQKWYQNRPLEMQPIVEIRSVEASEIDTEGDSSFPIPIYTSSVALQCNVVYHIASRLLLSRKPLLLRLSTRQGHLTSQGWHVQQISGIAARNDFAEQWDPILIAGLLWIANDMSHPSQQEALLECFRRITASTGFSLDEEIMLTHAMWDASLAGDRLSN